ncbi:hypothetical protein [Staphylococcus gallinarum]|uniref:Uncharacterized protein n=1 Tax=Staphylococcus gallinarum TaxID=1293 RepID=A0A2T4T046_STAGA|nr:hypothetical protein [Staphylococcus gallinarum]MBU7217595.1 hypothetical protein [Staphylococcus gallinarum]MCD8872139.1 hypothetical protein [Staphylococcus gallinarum]PTE75906.1 hypothetical protein BUY96_09295 [Staphylococcus gallinarum]PTL11123.1 hypothetical protein BUZ15_04885 [Staphylococcus gallinarum]RIL28185.1 hypothetical protein BUY98_13890 [Staphylococcus gallinarum]
MEGKFELPQKLATLSLFGLGVFVDIRGVYWFINQESVLNESEFYRALHEVMPIWLWGFLLLVFGTSLILASLFFGKRSINNVSNYFMLIGGTGSAIIHFLMASAGIYNSINWLTPAQFVVMTAWLGFVGFMGGVDIYGRR